MTIFCKALDKVAAAVLEALIMSLELTNVEADNVRELHQGYDHRMRLAHYLPLCDNAAADREQVSRCCAHKDWK
jgi:isopenicillin N synthase-like dioxygenase